MGNLIMMWELTKVRTKKSYDAYYWLVSVIVYFVLTIVFSIMIIRFVLQDQKYFFIVLVAEALMLLLGCIVVKTAARLLCEYQFESSGITEYSAFRRKRAIAWNDYPYVYIVWMGPLFRLPHSCTRFFLFSKSPLPVCITKEKYKDITHYYNNPKEYLIFGYSEDLEQKICEIYPEITFVKRDLL